MKGKGLVRGAGLWYRGLLDRRPVLTQSLQTAVLMGAGDVISQSAFEKHRPHDLGRTLTFALMGAAIGPSMYLVYARMEKVLGAQLTPANLLKKVAVDQLIGAPITLATFMSCVSLLEGRSLEETRCRLESDYLDVLICNYKVWPLVQIVNFSLMPVDYRVLFLQSIAVGWNTYLSWRIHRDGVRTPELRSF